MERDYAVEMREIIDEATRGRDGYVAATVAAEIVNRLRATDPQLLAGWLDAQAVQVVRTAISSRDHSIRAYTRSQAKAAAFREAVDEMSRTGDTSTVFPFLSMPFTVGEDVRKPLGRLTHDDLLFVQQDYDSRARENTMYAAVMGQLAEKVTTGVVEDHFTEVQIANFFAMFR